jgi:transcriptional regulator with XRE-family HTH domain
MGNVTDSENSTMRARRKRAGFTIKQVADRAGVAPNTVSRVEKGLDAHKRELVMAAFEELLAERGYPRAGGPEPDERNLRAVDVHVPSGQSVIAVDLLRDFSSPDMTAMLVIAAGDKTPPDVVRKQIEELLRLYYPKRD